MVGIVVVSHSEALADGVVRVAREMGGAELALEAAGGIEEEGILGTDAERVRAAIERAMSPDGVLVLMDLGSALLSAEFAVDLLGEASGPVRLSSAPIVEGAVAAAAAAAGGASLDEVAAEARGALAMKAAQIDEPEAEATVAEQPVAGVGARAKLPVLNAIRLHARPAARLIELVRGFDADVRVAKLGAGDPVSARSLTNLIALGARRGDTLVVSASGPQAHEVVQALGAFAGGGFGDGVASETTNVASPPPAGLPAAALEVAPAPRAGAVLTGVAASAGIAIGPALSLAGGGLRAPADRAAGSASDERAKLDEALAAARDAIERDRASVAARAGDAEAEIFDAHLTLLDDEALRSRAQELIVTGATAESAWYDAAQSVAEIYRGLSEPLLRERAIDVLDVGRRVVAAMTGGDDERALSGIVIADELTPADAAGLHPERVLAIATARGSSTAHAAILARALGLPAVVGLGAAILSVSDGTNILVDGQSGTVTVEPSTDLLHDAIARREHRRVRAAAARERALEPGATRDGTRIEVFANLGSVAEATAAVSAGAEGVGLLRTEFLFLHRASLPDEEEQVETLREIAVALAGRPLVVRTLDAGADKPLPALPMPREDNPFLGVRGIRLSLERPELLATQFRAILRVAAEHPLKVMLPMVATVAEVLAARAIFDEARSVVGGGVEVELGIMVEVPAAALTAARLAAHVDFFSIGTNDLTQYAMAAERGDARLAELLAGPQPAVLALVHAAVQAADGHGRWVGVCGELAGDPACAVLFAGLGVTELSMASSLIPEVKEALRQVDLADARAAARTAVGAPDAEAARALALALLRGVAGGGE
jgi:multiphosphoryl transfer protein